MKPAINLQKNTMEKFYVFKKKIWSNEKGMKIKEKLKT